MSSDRSVDLRLSRDGAPGVGFALLLAAACLVAALPWLRAYTSTGSHVALLLAAATPVLLAPLASRVLRFGAPLGFTISALALVATLLFASDFTPDALGSALVYGTGRLLTETLPLAGGAIAAPVLVAVWTAGAVAGELAFRPAHTAQLSGASLALPLLSFVFALDVTAPAPGRQWVAAPAILLLLAAAAAARQQWRDRSVASVIADESGTPYRRRSYRPIGFVALLAVIVGLGVPALPGVRTERASVYESPPTASSLLVDPVATIGALRDSGSAGRSSPLLRVVTRAITDGYLTVAVLDDFDGSEWTFASTFAPSGGRVPAPAGYVGPVVDTSRVSATATVLTRLPVPMLPVFERPTRVEGIPVAADAAHGMVVPDQRVRLPARYTMVSASPLVTLADVPGVDGLDGLAAAGAGGGAGDLALPADSANAIATAARFVASITGARPVSSVAFLQQAMAALQRTERRVVPAAGTPSGGALGGTSLSAVINAITVKRSATPEQFATFFALVARYLGVPARIATGFRIQTSAGSATVPAGAYSVSGRQAWTWVELPVAGLGWVVADPTPVLTTAAGAPPPEQVQASPTTLPAPRANAVPRDGSAGGHAVARPVVIRTRGHGGLPGWVLAVAITAAALFLLGFALAIPALSRRHRTKKRFSSDPALLAGGAWLELIDALWRAGMQVPDGSTSSEVATEAGRHFGAGVPAGVKAVGRVADRAMCSLADPPDWETALDAWESQRRLVREIHSGLERHQRVLTRLTVGTPQKERRW